VVVVYNPFGYYFVVAEQPVVAEPEEPVADNDVWVVPPVVVAGDIAREADIAPGSCLAEAQH
jgi:hypothetical protein